MTSPDFEHLVGPARLGELQAGVDKRTNAAGGKMVQQRVCRRFANIRPVVEAVDGEEANRWADLVVLAHGLHEAGVGRAVEAAIRDHQTERRQHREIAAETLAADRVEDQVGPPPRGGLAHPRDDVVGAVIERVRGAEP